MLKSEKITLIGILLNFTLFLSKLIVGLISKSSALISDSLNSFSDIIASICIYISVKVSNKKADSTHPFGHDRAEPIAAFIVAIFTVVLGFEIAKSAFLGLFLNRVTNIGNAAIGVLIFSIIVKLSMASYYLKKAEKRPAIRALGIDSRNDVLTSLIALFGVIAAIYGFPKFDDIAALIISIFILNSGYNIGKENIDYLMGKTPSKVFLDHIKKISLSINGVKGINEVKAQFVGNKIQMEVHIEVDKDISTKKSHDIGKKVQHKIEAFRDIRKVFVHVDPV